MGSRLCCCFRGREETRALAFAAAGALLFAAAAAMASAKDPARSGEGHRVAYAYDQFIDERWQARSAIWTGLRMSGDSNEDMRSVRSALREIEESGERFWERCKVLSRPMPEGFLPPNIQAEPWPTYDDFSLRGLP